ncbi:hypothetical protein [Agathobacter sp.]
MENNKLSTGVTVWLWIIFVLNVIISVTSLLAVLGASAIAVTLGLGAGYVVLVILSAILEIVVTVSIGIILFGHKKVGIKMLIVVAVIGFVINMITYGVTGQFTIANILKAIISAIVVPAVTILLAKNDVANGTLA